MKVSHEQTGWEMGGSRKVRFLMTDKQQATSQCFDEPIPHLLLSISKPKRNFVAGILVRGGTGKDSLLGLSFPSLKLIRSDSQPLRPCGPSALSITTLTVGRCEQGDDWASLRAGTVRRISLGHRCCHSGPPPIQNSCHACTLQHSLRQLPLQITGAPQSIK